MDLQYKPRIEVGSLIKCVELHSALELGRLYVVTELETFHHSGTCVRVGIFNSGVEQWFNIRTFILA